MYEEEQIKKILKTAMKSGGDYADLYLTRNYSGTIAAEDKKIEHFYRGFDEGAGIRVMKGDFSAYFYTNDLAYDALLGLAARAGESIGASANDAGGAFGWQEIKDLGKKDSEAYDLEKVGRLIKQVNANAWQISDKIVQVSLGYGDSRKEVLTASTIGKWIQRDVNRKRFFVRSSPPKTMSPNRHRNVRRYGRRFSWDEGDAHGEVKAAASRALKQLTAETNAPIRHHAGGALFRPAAPWCTKPAARFWNGCVSKGLSLYKDKIGEKVASKSYRDRRRDVRTSLRL